MQTSDESSELACLHAIECAKDATQLKVDMDKYADLAERSPDYWQRPSDEELDELDVLGQGTPGRIFDSILTHPERGSQTKII